MAGSIANLGPRRWRAGEAEGVGRLHERLASERPKRLAITGVPNARVLTDLQTWELVCDEAGPATAGQLRRHLKLLATAGIDPEVFWKLGDELGYDVEIGWTGSGEQGASTRPSAAAICVAPSSNSIAPAQRASAVAIASWPTSHEHRRRSSRTCEARRGIAIRPTRSKGCWLNGWCQPCASALKNRCPRRGCRRRS